MKFHRYMYKKINFFEILYKDIVPLEGKAGCKTILMIILITLFEK